jgi:hypothetical protein
MASRPRFRFDAVAHAYYVGDARLPSITQILSATADGGICPYYTEETAARGTRIHQATARFDLGGGWGDDLLVADVPRVRAYAAFLHALHPTYKEIEQPHYSPTFAFAGTPDRVGAWADGRAFVLDLKTGPPLPDHGLQTAGQVLVLRAKPQAYLRYTLHLHDDETYRLIPWKDAQDFPKFLRRFTDFMQGSAEIAALI